MKSKTRSGMTTTKGLAGKPAEPKAAVRPIVLVVNGPCSNVLIEAPAEGCMSTPSLYFRPRFVNLHAGHVDDAEMPKGLIPLAEKFNRRVKALAAADVALAARKSPEGSPARQRTYKRYLTLSATKLRLIRRAEILYQKARLMGHSRLGIARAKALTAATA